MKSSTVISNARDCFIELTHRNTDPGIWIVRRWTKFLWFKRRISSDWFSEGQQAFAFANKLKREHNGHSGLHQKMELTVQESRPRRQSDDEARWQDDGGESG